MKFLATILLVVCPLGALCQFNMTAYREMPPLFNLEDYDMCLDNAAPSSYCVVIGEIVPNTTSALWNNIAQFSSVTKRHFRHDHLYFGICLNRCKELVESFNSTQQDELYEGPIKYTEVSEFFEDIYKNEPGTRHLYDKVINTCLNYNFAQQYGLRVRSYTQYCESNNKPSGFDFSEIAFMTILGTILFLVVLSSNYDRQLKQKQAHTMQGNAFYQEKLDTQQDTLLTSFSVCRNYYRLIYQANAGLARDLRFFETFRFFSTLMVVFAHVLLLIKGLPIQNADFVEKIFYQMKANLFISGTVIIQIFLVMSSFLLCINFQKSLALKKPGLAEWGQLILYRYLRLAPSLGFVILLNASILPRLQDGPFWKYTTDSEYELCRETWWKNLLFFNNFTLRKSCLHQTWYVATDFQLYVILTALLIIIARFPKTRNFILGAGVVASFLTTGLVTYFLELNGTHQETPNSYRYLFWTDSDTLYQGYAPFYMNFGGFFFGVIAGLVFLRYKNKDLNMKGKKSKINIIVLCSIPVPFLILLSGEIFYRFQFTKPSIWIGIYAGLHRNVWALMCSVLILLMSFKVGSILYRFSSMRMFVPLGRLSFQVYLIHTVMIRCIAGCFRQPVYANNLTLAMYILSSVVLSFAAAFFLYLFFELPLTTLVNAAVRGSAKSVKQIESHQANGTNTNKEETPTA